MFGRRATVTNDTPSTRSWENKGTAQTTHDKPKRAESVDLNSGESVLPSRVADDRKWTGTNGSAVRVEAPKSNGPSSKSSVDSIFRIKPKPKPSDICLEKKESADLIVGESVTPAVGRESQTRSPAVLGARRTPGSVSVRSNSVEDKILADIEKHNREVSSVASEGKREPRILAHINKFSSSADWGKTEPPGFSDGSRFGSRSLEDQKSVSRSPEKLVNEPKLTQNKKIESKLLEDRKSSDTRSSHSIIVGSSSPNSKTSESKEVNSRMTGKTVVESRASKDSKILESTVTRESKLDSSSSDVRKTETESSNIDLKSSSTFVETTFEQKSSDVFAAADGFGQFGSQTNCKVVSEISRKSAEDDFAHFRAQTDSKSVSERVGKSVEEKSEQIRVQTEFKSVSETVKSSEESSRRFSKEIVTDIPEAKIDSSEDEDSEIGSGTVRMESFEEPCPVMGSRDNILKENSIPDDSSTEESESSSDVESVRRRNLINRQKTQSVVGHSGVSVVVTPPPMEPPVEDPCIPVTFHEDQPPARPQSRPPQPDLIVECDPPASQNRAVLHSDPSPTSEDAVTSRSEEERARWSLDALEALIHPPDGTRSTPTGVDPEEEEEREFCRVEEILSRQERASVSPARRELFPSKDSGSRTSVESGPSTAEENADESYDHTVTSAQHFIQVSGIFF